MSFTQVSPVAAQNFDKGSAAYNAGDYATALENWRPLAEQGDAVSQNAVGVMYSHGKGVRKNYRKAARWFRKAADQEYAVAQRNLGMAYIFGEGVREDRAAAVRLFRLAAEQGDAKAQFHLGTMYDTGQGGLPEDDVLALMWWNIAESNGMPAASGIQSIQERYMSREQVADAKVRARACMSSGYKDCD